MLETLHHLAANRFVQGALTGFVSAAAVDYHAFMKFQNIHEAASYGWGLAAWRWLQGIVGGLVTTAGLWSLS